MQTFNLKETSVMKWSLVVLLGMGFFVWPTIFGESSKSPSYPSLIGSLRIDTPLEFCDERVPLEMQEIRERLEKELLLTLWDRPQVILWLKRSRRYLPYIEKMLQQSGLPDDLKFVPIAESALRPHAGSRKGAIGFWQFMKHTGRQHGLVINRRIDERRNIFASTQGAVRYFQGLHKTFGSWSLAAAAYNMGAEALAEEIQEQGIDDYYLLYLPLETQRYVFRILSIKLIFSDPKKYGFRLADKDYYPPLEFDRIQINCHHDTHLRIIAQAAKTHFKAIKDLNPEIRGYTVPAGKLTMLIPKGASQDFDARFQLLLNHRLMNQKEHIYVVKEGDTLSSVADRFGVPLSAIITWNHLNPTVLIHPGDKLTIYQEGLKPIEPDQVESKEALP
jgi:membrane-bound lytic murein transglycosylase D